MGRVHKMTREISNSRMLAQLIAVQGQQRDIDDTDSTYCLSCSNYQLNAQFIYSVIIYITL
jgi:hypothetical protein